MRTRSSSTIVVLRASEKVFKCGFCLIFWRFYQDGLFGAVGCENISSQVKSYIVWETRFDIFTILPGICSMSFTSRTRSFL